MKIYIHIGDARTGTTTLQRLLTRNRATLASMGVAYPTLGTMQNSTGSGQHRLAFSLLPEWPHFAINGKAPADTVWQEFTDYLDQLSQETHTVLISSEAFLNIKEDGLSYLKDILSDHDVVPICVKRNAEDWRRSWIAHQTRQGVVVQGAKKPARDLAQPKIDRWNKVFDVVCIPYSSNTSKEILALLSVDIDLLEPVERSNARLKEGQLDLLTQLNGIPMEEAHRGAMLDAIKASEAADNQRIVTFIQRVRFAGKNRSKFNEAILGLWPLNTT